MDGMDEMRASFLNTGHVIGVVVLLALGQGVRWYWWRGQYLLDEWRLRRGLRKDFRSLRK